MFTILRGETFLKSTVVLSAKVKWTDNVKPPIELLFIWSGPLHTALPDLNIQLPLLELQKDLKLSTGLLDWQKKGNQFAVWNYKILISKLNDTKTDCYTNLMLMGMTERTKSEQTASLSFFYFF